MNIKDRNGPQAFKPDLHLSLKQLKSLHSLRIILMILSIYMLKTSSRLKGAMDFNGAGGGGGGRLDLQDPQLKIARAIQLQISADL